MSKGLELSAKESLRRLFKVPYSFAGITVDRTNKYYFAKALEMEMLKSLSVEYSKRGDLFLIGYSPCWFVRKEMLYEDMVNGPLLHVLGEPTEYRLASKVCGRGSIFVDVGAYIARANLQKVMTVAIVSSSLVPLPPAKGGSRSTFFN